MKMSDRTTAGQPPDSRDVSTPCPSVSKAGQVRSGQVTNPHSSRIMALRDVHPLDAMAATVALIRPDWNPEAIRAVLARTHGSTHELARRALTVALDPDQRTPLGIENADLRRYEPTPGPQRYAPGGYRCGCPDCAASAS